MNTQTHRIVSGLMVALMVGLVAVGWLLVAQPQLAAAATSNDQLENLQSQVAASQASLQQLQAEKSKLGELTTQLTGLQESMPSDLASSPLVAGLDEEAKAAGVFITNIVVSDPVAYAPASTSGAAVPTGGASPSPTPSATPTAPPAQVPASGPAAFSPKTDARITAANFVPVPVSITVRGDWDQTRAFVKALQMGSRMYAVATVHSGQDDAEAGQYNTAVTGYVFAVLDPASQAAAAAKKAAATPTSTPTPTASKKPAPTASATPFPSSSPTPSVTPSR